MGAGGGHDYERIGALIVDDEDDLRLLVRLAIDAHNQGLYVSGEASSGLDALGQLVETEPSVVVLDQMMPGMDGLETAGRMLALRPNQRIVLFSAFIDRELEAAALSSGIMKCLRKDDVGSLPKLLIDVARA